MFLSVLNDQEKELFLALSIHAANANGDFNEDEEELIKSYCYEMNILFFNPSKIATMDEITTYFKASKEKTKRIIALELIGLLNVDGTYDEQEKCFSSQFFKQIGLKEEKIEEITDAVDEYLKASKKLQYTLVD